MKRKQKKLLLAIIIFIVITDIYLVYLCSFRFFDMIIYGKQILQINKFVVVLGLVMIIYFEIILHESGHYLCGKFMDFQFYSFTIFPVKIEKVNNKVELKWTRNFLNHGSCFMLPEKIDRINSYLPVYYLCGPITNYILILISSIVFIFLTKPTPNLTFTTTELFAFICYNQITFILNLMPASYWGYSTDGTKLLYFIRNSCADKREIQHIFINLQLYAGIRPRDIKFIDFNEDRMENQDQDFLLNIFKFYHLLDKGDAQKSLKLIDLIEESKQKYYLFMGESVIYEIFYANCILRNDIRKVKELYLNLSNTINSAYKITNCRINMAFELYIKKNKLNALNIGKVGLEAIDDYPIKGLAIFESEQIKKMMKSIEIAGR